MFTVLSVKCCLVRLLSAVCHLSLYEGFQVLDAPFYIVTVTQKVTYEYAWQVFYKMVNIHLLSFNSAIHIYRLQVFDSCVRTKEFDFF